MTLCLHISLWNRRHPMRYQSIRECWGRLLIVLTVAALWGAILPQRAPAQASPSITQQPQSQSVVLASNVTFSVVASGQDPLVHRWYFNGGLLTNGGRILGAASASLQITNVQGTDAGNYLVTVSNRHDVVTSTVATLTVRMPPSIAQQPVDVLGGWGGLTVFTAMGAGDSPLNYQWQKDGTNLFFEPGRVDGVNSSNLIVTGLRMSDSGNYRLLLTNPYGSATSAVARLSVSPVVAWGDNIHGQLYVPQTLTNVLGIAAGEDYSLGLRSDGTVDGNAPPGPGTGLNNVVAISAGGQTIALRADGTVASWSGDLLSPVSGLTDVVAISAGYNHNLALRRDGTVVGWGSNNCGQTNPPAGLRNVIAIAAGQEYSLAVKNDGTIVGWGCESSGRMAPPYGLTNVVGVDAEWLHSLALKSDGTVAAWGASSQGQTSVPVNLSNVVAIAGGSTHSAALKRDGTVTMWGASFFTDITPPGGLANVVAIAGGVEHYLALIENPATVVPPSFWWPPPDSPVANGRTLVLKPILNGSLPMNFQWTFDGSPLPGETNNWLVLDSIQTNQTGAYRLLATNRHGFAISDPAAVTVLFPPAFTQQPTNRSVVWNNNTLLAAEIAGSSPIGYQWHFNGVPLTDDARHAGSTSNALFISSLLTNDSGNYTLVASNAVGVATSAVATLTVLGPPIIQTQPTSLHVVTSREARFMVTASGAPPLDYQWFFNDALLSDGERISGVTTATLTIQDSQSADMGNYFVVVSNPYGVVTSAVASLNLATQRFVNVNNPTPSAPYTSWATAATVIQDAIDVAGTADEIVVTNGVYSSGGAVGPYSYQTGNRVLINKPVTVVSVNGPAVTTIIGYAAPLVSSSGQRCAYVANGALLAGFTLTQGKVELTTVWLNKIGGGVWCDNGGVVSNCFILGNRAGYMGGGIMYGKAINCVIAGNYGKNYGGGMGHCELVNCTVVGNTSAQGGGVYAGSVRNSIIVNNQASTSANYYIAGMENCCTTPAPNGPGNLTNDPVFVNYPAGNYRLQFGSPCIDTGGNAFVASSLDSDAHPRVMGASVDMGAYEHQPAPWIYASPTNQSAVVFSNATLVVGVLGDEPLAYRWEKNGVSLVDDGRISGTGSAALSISPVAVGDGGSYQVFITNSLGSVTSAVATLTILGPPIISTQPASRSAPAGTNTTFSVTASGLAAISYQWRFNQSALTGRTNSTLSLTNIQSANEGGYDVILTNTYGALTSAVATLTVLPAAPVIATQVVTRVFSVGQDAALTVSAKGSEPMFCQWQREGTNLPGADAFTLVLSNVNFSHGGTYRALVSNAVASVFSTNLAVVVSPVLMWGQTNNGQLSASALLPAGATNVVAIAAASTPDVGLPTMALRADGTITTWGYSRAAPAPPSNAVNLVAISLNASGSTANNLVLRADGTVVNWSSSTKTLPASVTNGNIVAVAAGGLHQLALRDDGTVVAWGSNTAGQTNVPPGVTNIIAIAAGANHSLALRADGIVVGWGLNTSGQATALSNVANVVAIAANGNQTLALLADGSVAGCIVTNASGTAAYGPPAGSISNKLGIALGTTHSLAINADRSIAGWGTTNFGQLNIPAYATNALALAAGANNSLALVRDPFAPPIPPRIGRPPFGRMLMTGQDAVFNALAVGGLPLNYQWLRAGVPVSGQTRASLWFTNVHPSQAGDYQLVAMNEFSSVTSAVATVTVSIPAPTLLVSGVASNGFSFSFTSIAGVLYVIEHTGALNPASWIELERRFGIGGIETVFDPDALDEARYYRVRALFAPSPGLKSPTWNGTGLEFQFNTVPGARYVVEYKNRLDDANWIELSRQDATGSSLTVTDAGPHGESRFYRIKVE